MANFSEDDMYLKMLTDKELVRYAQGTYPAHMERQLVEELTLRLDAVLTLGFQMMDYAQPDPEADRRFGQPRHGHDEDDD